MQLSKKIKNSRRENWKIAKISKFRGKFKNINGKIPREASLDHLYQFIDL